MMASTKKSKQVQYKKNLFQMDVYNANTKRMYQISICSLAEDYRAQDRYDKLTARRQRASQLKESMDSLVEHFQSLYYKHTSKPTVRALIIKAYQSPETDVIGKRKLKEAYPFLKELICDGIDDEIDYESCSNYNEQDYEDSFDQFNEDIEYEASCDESENIEGEFSNTRFKMPDINKSLNSEMPPYGNWHSDNHKNQEINEEDSEDDHF